MFNSQEISRIKNANSRENFKFVLQSYYSQNYKASVLLLYNLVINDLYSKLKLMNENKYVNCENELNEINNILDGKNETKYSMVEEKIFKVYELKKILNKSTLDMLTYFKEIRNKCAHPIFFINEESYSPSSDEVYAFITKIYNDILIIDAFFKDPYDVMKDDIKVYYEFPSLELNLLGMSSMGEDTSKIKKYFEIKYFKCMTENNFKKLFKELMDITVKKRNDEIQNEQYKNFLVLNAMLEYLKELGNISILNNTYEWGNLSDKVVNDDDSEYEYSNKWLALTYLCIILTHNNKFLIELSEENELVFNKIKNAIYTKANLFEECWQIFDNDIHIAIKKIDKNLSWREYYRLIKKLDNMLYENEVIELMKLMIKKVRTYNAYDVANDVLDLLISVLKKRNLKQEDVNDIFKIINNNSQFYSKSRNCRDTQIKKIRDLGYDLSEYTHLKD